MKTFKENKEQIQADDKRRQEDERCIMIPVPKRFYCMEHKIYETPQDFNEEMNRRNQASERIKTAYEKGKGETAIDVVEKIIKAGTLDFSTALYINHNEMPTAKRIGRFYADVEKLNEALSEYGIEIKETDATSKE